MDILRIKFDVLWPGFNPSDNDFTRILTQKYKVEISEDPDFYFFTHSYNGKHEYLKYKCHRIFLGWENERADWNICDYVLDSDFVLNNKRHKRFPIWAIWNLQRLINPKKPEVFVKSKFCCMLVSNGRAKERIEFFKKLSEYKKVDSGGLFLNNIGRSVADKMDFIKDYKFVISFENSSYPGYTTEKLIEPMLANSIPIYWGNSEVGVDFNTKSFVNVGEYNNLDEAIERIKKLDTDSKAFSNMVCQPWFNNNKLPDEMTADSLLRFFDFIMEDRKTRTPVARLKSKKIAGMGSRMLKKIKFRLPFLQKNNFR